jgi:GTPase involved in cell partitioning and DNA repair
VIDIHGADGQSPRRILKELIKEIELYDKSPLERPKIIFANKYDMEGTRLVSSFPLYFLLGAVVA